MVRLLSKALEAVAGAPELRARYAANVLHNSGVPCPDVVAEAIPPGEMAEAQRTIVGWPDYAATPLVSLNGLARALDVAAVWVKDESSRFGLGSFKALGGAYAVSRLSAAVGRGEGDSGTAPQSLLTVTCATDGNHGRAVAWGAARAGCRAVIYIHADVSAGREQALRDLGAIVVRVAGKYDDSVKMASEDAAKHAWILVADTASGASDASPRLVMAGYTLLMAEIAAQLRGQAPPTHVVVQAGVGGLGAAVVAGACQAWGENRPRIVLAEPTAADCVFRSFRAGRRIGATGSLSTLMAGLACGEVSYWAWPVLKATVDGCVGLPDDWVAPVMQLLYDGVGGDPSLIIGESGVAGVAAIVAATGDCELANHMGITPESRILTIGTEGATDPDIYWRLVQRRAAKPTEP